TRLHHRDNRAWLKFGDQFGRDLSCQRGTFRSSAETTQFAAGVEQEQNIGGYVTQTAELLSHAIFEHQNIVKLERGIVMAVSIESDNREPHLFSENPDAFLIFGLLG